MSSLSERIEQLCGPDERLLGSLRADVTEEGQYFLVVRAWPHPDEENCWTISFRYAYLTRTKSGSDGWVGGENSSKAAGINMRAYGDPRQFMHAIGAMFSAASERFPKGEPWMGDVVDLEE